VPPLLRPVRAEDVDQVVALALRAWAPVHASMAAVLGSRLTARIHPDWAAGQEGGVRAVCADPETDVTVAVDGAAVLGFVAVVRSGAAGEIDMIAVDPAAQRRGVGRALTEHALDQLRAAGCTLAVVDTGGDPGHAPARALYEAAGFTGLPLVRYYHPLIDRVPAADRPGPGPRSSPADR
jgi:ribosomal protein S18 acetylase RimI-like enzyme